MMSARKTLFAVTAAVLTVLWAIALIELPPIAANGLLHPARRRVDPARRGAGQDVRFEGAGVTLEGWKFPAQGSRRGTVIYLHGVADKNAGSTT
jgi:hypothetical protein